jgi:hypothetical protein
MSIRRFSGHALAALFAIIASACATSPAATTSGGGAAGAAAPATSGSATENTIRVEVRQNKLDAGTTTVYIEPAAGVRTALGTLDPGETKTFSYNATGVNRSVKLVALDASGSSTTSQTITVPRGAGLTWDLQINAVRVKR